MLKFRRTTIVAFFLALVAAGFMLASYIDEQPRPRKHGKFDLVQNAHAYIPATMVTEEIFLASEATCLTAMSTRTSLECFNNSSTDLWCRAGYNSQAVTPGHGRPIAPGRPWALDIDALIPFCCIAAGEDQVDGGATICTQIP